MSDTASGSGTPARPDADPPDRPLEDSVFRELLDHALDGVFLADPDGHYLWANPAGLAMVGYTLDELRTLSLTDLVSPDEQVVRPLAMDALLPGRTLVRSRNLLRSDGTGLPAEIAASRLPDGRVLGFVRDLRDRVRTIRELERERSFSDAVLDTVAALVVVLDRQGTIVEFNRACEDTTGHTRDEMLGAPVWRLLPAEEQAAIEDVFRELRDDAIPNAFENHWVTRDGERRRIAWSNTVLAGPHGVDYVIATGIDVTERRLMEEELLNVQRLQSLGVLAGGIAHDFNNLLTAIQGNLSVARRRASDDPDLLTALVQAERAAGAATGLTRQLLTFATGGEPRPEVLDLEDLLREVADFAVHGTTSRCHLELPAWLPPVEADPSQLRQAFQNLIINAQQAMPHGGTVTVRARVLDGTPPTVRVEVVDQGPGIPTQEQGRIFDPFFTTKPDGTGLGLAVTHSIIRRHGGSVRALSPPGSGAVLQVDLPASERAAPSPEARAGSGASEVPGGLRILVMDDEAMVREVLLTMLEELGLEGVGVPEGAAAVEAWTAAEEAGCPFDLAIMDLTVPGGIGGVEALRILREHDPDVKAVVSSGYAHTPQRTGADGAGFCASLAKPYRLEDLARVLREVTQA